MKRFEFAILTILMSLTFVFAVTMAQQQPTGVTAETSIRANVRANTTIESDIVMEIFPGTAYPVIGRSELYPWVLIADPVTLTPIGWVYNEVVTIRGNLNNVPLSSLIITDQPTPTPTLSVQIVSPEALPQPEVTGTPAPATATPAYSVYGLVQGEVNIRYGPGLDYERLGVAQPGTQLEITGYHTQFPWVQIRFESSPNGFGWIAIDLLDVTGNIFNTQAIGQTFFNLPTLTPTPAIIQTGPSDTPLSAGFKALGNQLWNIVLAGGFDPETSRFGSLFVMDLQTGESFSFGSEFAFSGTSIQKISILAKLYGRLDAPPDVQTATDIANTMICSENSATNRLIGIVGNDDLYLGSEEVTAFLSDLGLEKTFITAPYIVDEKNPPPPTRPISYPETSADQVKANPDLSNQITVDEMGLLLADVYNCAYNESGPLIETFDGQYEPRECRQLLHVMSNNNVDALLKAGVPEDTRVAHKHGWIPDTHGNAAVFFTPGGNYVITIMLHQPEWLNYSESLPVIAEVSRTVYNYFNPGAPMPAIRDGFIPDAVTCNFAGTPLIVDIMSSLWEE